MKTQQGLLIVLILLVTFSSCQKDISNDFPDGVENDSSNLKKVISFDTTRPAGLDTGIVHEYFYDNLKRVSKGVFTEYGAGGIQYTHTARFYYLNTDTLPFKQVETDYFNTDSSITYFTYSNGFIVKDSLVHYTAGLPEPLIKRVFFKLNNNLYQVKKYFFNSVSQAFYLTDSVTYTRTLANGNMLGGTDSTWSSTYYPLPQTLRFNHSFDNQKNPFNYLNFWSLGYYENLFAAEFDFYGKNNLTGYSSMENPPSSGSGITNITIHYSYRSDGYPLTGYMTGNQDFNKIVFVYTKL